MAKNPQFLSLCADIRHEIYDHLLIPNGPDGRRPKLLIETAFDKGGIQITWNKSRDIETHTPNCGYNARSIYKLCSPQILFTCKTIYNEALPTLYAKNCFFVRLTYSGNGCNTCYTILRIIGSAGASHIRFLAISTYRNASFDFEYRSLGNIWKLLTMHSRTPEA